MAVNDYVTLAELRELFIDSSYPASVTTYDTLMTKLITRASRAFDRATNRIPGAFKVDTAVTRYYDGSGCKDLWIDELAAAPASVSVAESGDVDNAGGTGGTYTAWAVSDYLLWPPNALGAGFPYQRLDIDTLNGSKAVWYAYPRAVKISGKFGFSTTVPDDVLMATAALAIRLFKRASQGFQDAGVISDLQQLRYVKQTDPDVANTLERLQRIVI